MQHQPTLQGLLFKGLGFGVVEWRGQVMNWFRVREVN